MKCLVVDPSATMRRVLINALRETGCETLEAADGKQALERCGREVDAVLTAWNVPGMSGIELLRKLRENPETAEIRVMMVTGRNLRQDVMEAIQAGVNSYLLKPFTQETLRIKLGELLRMPEAEEQAEAEAA
jgi:two-component system chemotaxis response regulator CheY